MKDQCPVRSSVVAAVMTGTRRDQVVAAVERMREADQQIAEHNLDQDAKSCPRANENGLVFGSAT